MKCINGYRNPAMLQDAAPLVIGWKLKRFVHTLLRRQIFNACHLGDQHVRSAQFELRMGCEFV
jgi:hypothetical protein